MSDEPPGGRARGRGGRGRGKPPPQQAPGHAAPPQQAPGHAAPPQQASGYTPSPQQAPGRVAPPQQAVQPPTAWGGAAVQGASRGRGRATQQPAAVAEQPTPPTAATAAVGQIPPPEGHIGGRGVHRGSGRERGHAGGDPSREMARLGLQDAPYKRRNPYDKYIDKAYKDEGKNPHGSHGTAVELITNYFNVTLPSEFKIYQYHVDFNPEVESIRVKYALISNLDIVTGTVKCFDGGILYLCKLLPNEITECYATRSYDGAIIKIVIKRVAEVFSNTPQFIQIVNLLFKRVQTALDMKLIRDHYFNPSLSIQIRAHKLEVMPGFSTSILNYEAGNLLGVDIIHKILRIDTFLDCLYNLYDSMNARDIRAFHAAAVKNFVGTIVITRYNNKTYRVDDIDWESRPTSTFEKGGEQIDYITYFKQRWNIDIIDRDQPLLVTKPTERDKRRGDRENLNLIPELCTITGLSDEARSDFNVMRDLAVHTRIGPERRLETLEDFLKQINESAKVREILAPWQTTFDRQALRIPARQFPAENLIMKGSNGAVSNITDNIKEADWSREMRNCKLLNPVNMNVWLLIYPQQLSAPANELADCLNRVGRGMGMIISDPTRVELNNDRNDTYLQGIRQNLDPTIQMVVVVAPNSKKDRYDAVKKSCCIDNPVPSQVVLERTLRRRQGLMSVATKIAIQMNCKMGGEVWGVDIPVNGMMIVGIDSYHDSANKGQSVGALVASLNKQCTRYYSMTEYHPSGNDLLNGMTTMLAVALRKYHEVNRELPSRIIFYRDGVGDGQLNQVFQHECEQVSASFSAVGGDAYRPNFAYIIVKKRINTRLFSSERNQVINPQPGTLVDTHITKRDWYDFFLISQSVRQGTVTPTSYNIIYDRSGLQPDHMQRLTYKLTHMYFNWQGTIRVPAPCQYAHKLAFLQGQSLHRQFSALLADKLFYL